MSPAGRAVQIIEFAAGTLRFADALPESAPADGFVWVFLEREALEGALPSLQALAQRVGGSALLDLHARDLANEAHPSHYDYTSIYDLIVFRRLATQDEAAAEQAGSEVATPSRSKAPPAFRRIATRAVGFAVFDRLLISVHPGGCFTARAFIQRYLSDAVHAEGSAPSASARSRLPTSPADLALRMINVMVDSYLDLRRTLTTQLEHWQAELLNPASRFNNWAALMDARNQLHTLEDLCDEQHDAMQEWLDTVREQPVGALPQAERDSLVARMRDVIEHIERVMHHVRRLEQSAETVVQIHFSALSHRTNETMRTLTALTAIFLPLTLVTGIFGMNFEQMPLLKLATGFWLVMGLMAGIAAALGLYFWRKRYIARSTR